MSELSDLSKRDLKMQLLSHPKYRPLLITALALVLTPVFLLGIGLTYDVATVVVLLALAAMGLNLLVGYTGLVSFEIGRAHV